MRIVVSSVLALGLAAAGCSSSDETKKPPVVPEPAKTTEPTATAPSNLEKTACRFTVPRSLEGKQYDCYDLSVPENRSNQASRTIKIHSIVFKGKAGGTPTIELNGGPGGPSEDIAVSLAIGEPEAKASVGRFLEVGDYVLVDQRGTGRSVPRLACATDESGGPPAGGPGGGSDPCLKKHQEQGIDLTGYVTAENAEDIHDLKVALGAKTVNLHAISYGTRLALEILRLHPEDVAGTIIDGVMPAQARALSEGDYNIDLLLTKIFADCAADAKCNAAYPKLDESFAAAKKKLDETPFTIDGYPYDWYAFWGELAQSLYGDGVAGTVPKRISDVVTMTQEQFEKAVMETWSAEMEFYQKREELMKSTELGKEVAQRMQEDPDPAAAQMADGMYMSVVCSDYAQYESREDALALEAKVRPEIRSDDMITDTFDSCVGWPKRAKADNVFTAVVSDKPVLAIAGTYDPVTPPVWRDLAASTLSKSQKVTMGAGAHGSMDACAFGFKMAFLNAPDAAVDGACAAAQKIEFAYATAGGSNLHRHAKRTLTPTIIRPIPLAPSINAALKRTQSRGARAPHLIPSVSLFRR